MTERHQKLVDTRRRFKIRTFQNRTHILNHTQFYNNYIYIIV